MKKLFQNSCSGSELQQSVIVFTTKGDIKENRRVFFLEKKVVGVRT